MLAFLLLLAFVLAFNVRCLSMFCILPLQVLGFVALQQLPDKVLMRKHLDIRLACFSLHVHHFSSVFVFL